MESLYIKVCSDFDGMVDCVVSVKEEFSPVVASERCQDHNYGIQGAWFVHGSRDYCSTFNNGSFEGYEVSNCCGSFIIAKKITK